MKYFSYKLFVSIAVIATVFLIFNRYVEGVIGDFGKPSQRGIIEDNKPSPEVSRLIFKQSLLQDVAKIKEEINVTEAKLNKANEGDDLYPLTITKISIPNLRNQINALSQKVAEELKGQRNNKELLKLSENTKQAMDILNSLEQKAKANMKSASLEFLNKLSDVVRILQKDINKLGPQPEPPD